MPVYEYKCKTCETTFDIEQSFSDDSLTELEGCEQDASGSHQLKKIFNAVGISFKGEGFYKNDSRGSSSASTPSASPSTESSTDTKTDTSKDSSDTKTKKPADSTSSTKPEKTKKTKTASKTA